jgi:hypothetical protein
LKDGGTLIVPTLARVGELAVHAHTLDRCGVQELLLDGAVHFSTLDARRVSVTVKCIPLAVIWYIRDRGTRVGFIGMRGRERSRPVV